LRRSNPAFVKLQRKLDCFAALAMTLIDPDMRLTLAALSARGFAGNFLTLQIRGRRESRVRAAPAVSCANCTRKNAHEHTGPAEASDFPCAMVYGLWRALPGEPCTFATVARAPERNLDTSVGVSGPHDFAVRFQRPRQERQPRPLHPRPALVTLRNAPPDGTGWLFI